uniref:Uncharacterized protein n=1 Tax=Arundo donax TaxID=35708 RepID=A0A0A9G661_ARUDO
MISFVKLLTFKFTIVHMCQVAQKSEILISEYSFGAYPHSVGARNVHIPGS